MDVLAWLAFPMIATALAMCWAAWRGRARAPRRGTGFRGSSFTAVDDFRRFTDAMLAPTGRRHRRTGQPGARRSS